MLLLTSLLTLANSSTLLPSVVRKGLDNVAATNSLDTTDGFDNVNNASGNDASGNDTSGNDTSSNVVIDLAGSVHFNRTIGSVNSKTVIDMKNKIQHNNSIPGNDGTTNNDDNIDLFSRLASQLLIWRSKK